MADVPASVPAVPAFSIYDRMAKARESCGIKSTEVMAKLLNELLKPEKPWSPSTVAAWERGANQPRRMQDIIDAYAFICSREAARLGKAVVVTPEWLYTGAESPKTRSEKSRRAADLGLSVIPGPKSVQRKPANRTLNLNVLTPT